MPRDKDFKRLVRARMKKTGESYTAARARLLDKNPSLPDAEYARLAGLSDESVRASTGRSWKAWTGLLDEAEAWRLPHAEIAAFLSEDLGLGGWWAQMVTVGYERIRGLREVGQRRDGTWEASKTKTVPVPVGALYAAFRDPDMRARWLPGVDLEVRAATPGKVVRFTREDGSSVVARFTGRSASKSTVTIEHGELADAESRRAMKAFWGERLEALARLVSDTG